MGPSISNKWDHLTILFFTFSHSTETKCQRKTNLSAFGFFKRKGNEDDEKKKRLSDDQKNYDKEKRQRHFLESWKERFPGIQHKEEEGLIFCDICVRHKDIADKTSNLVTGCSSFRTTSIASHWESAAHKLCAAPDVQVKII